MIKTCPQCGKEFQTYNTKKKFCSRNCQYKNRTKDKSKICPVCGKQFEAKKNTQIFCSVKCSSINQQSCQDKNNTKTRLHQIWSNMKTRCNNPNFQFYEDYGGRGIKVCKEWKDSFVTFYDWALNNGYSNELTLDRINVNNNYEPNNCRWATKQEQANNRRDNRFLTYNNETLSIGQWAKKVGLSWDILDWRLRNVWTLEQSLFTPKMKNQYKTKDNVPKQNIDFEQIKLKYNY